MSDRYLPKHLSYSALDTYLRCGKSFELERVVKVPRVPAFYFVGGSAVHDLTEEVDRLLFADELTLAAAVEMDFVSEFRDTFDRLITKEEDSTEIRKEEWSVSGLTKALPSGKDYWWWLVEGPKMVARWVAWRQTSSWTLWEYEGDPGIEIPLNLTLALVEPKLKAFPDRIMVTPTGELACLDLKTGVRKPESNLQLGVYAVAMEKAGLERPKYGTYWMALKGEHTFPVDLDHYTEEVIDEMFSQFYKGTQAGIFLPRTGGHCNYLCRVQQYCAVQNGAEAHLYDPLSPEYTGGKQ
jgi:RecB family exonuclease